jgi:hypothetical protein
MPAIAIDTFTNAYIEAALFSSTDESRDDGGDPMDDNYTVDDIAPATLAKMAEDCRLFQSMFSEFIQDDVSLAGYHFWMTRNGHGTGFWNGMWDQPYDLLPEHATVGDYLTAMCKPFGEFDLYVGDDGMIHGS